MNAPLQIYIVKDPGGKVVKCGTHLEDTIGRAVVVHGKGMGWVGMLNKGWKWEEGVFVSRSILDRDGRERALRKRILSYPLAMESLAIARHLQNEGWYAASTRLCDIARRVESIRKQSRASYAEQP